MHAEVEKAPSPTNSHPDPKPELSVHETSDQDLKPTEAKRRVPEEWKRALSQLFIARTASPDPHSVTAVWPPCSVPSSVILHDLVDPPVFFSSFEDWVDFFFLCWPLRLDEPRENTLPIGEHQLKIGGEDFFEKMKQLLEANMTDPDVMEEHVAYLERLGVSEEDQLPPAIAGTDCFNPVLERFWKPWAK